MIHPPLRCNDAAPALGFTLIEMSIVLVIIGLIVGGILVGNDLVNGARVRGLISQKAEFDTAVFTFKNKYGGLPGDLKNTYEFFGSDLNCTNAGVAIGGSGCNGNDDGRIQRWGENARFWHVLSASNLISHDITTAGNLTTDDAATTANGPAGYLPRAYDDVYWSVFCTLSGVGGCHANFVSFDGSVINHYRITASRGAGGVLSSYDSWRNGFITPVLAKQLDEKMDDGFAISGQVRATTGLNHAVHGICGPPWIDYNVANPSHKDTKSCELHIAVGF